MGKQIIRNIKIDQDIIDSLEYNRLTREYIMQTEKNKLNSILNKLSWFFVGLCIIGSIANICKLWWSFALWSVCNVYLIVHNYLRKEYAQAFLFFVYLIISLYGMISWYLAA